MYFEQSGKQEVPDMLAFMRILKESGMPFGGWNSTAAGALTANEFPRIVLGVPIRLSKQTPMLKIADLFLFPTARGGYDCSYRPHRTLMSSGDNWTLSSL